MKVTIYQFLNLPDEEQYNIVFTEGDCVEIRLEGTKRFVLYAVDLFFVEVEFDGENNLARNKTAFVAGEMLDKYSLF